MLDVPHRVLLVADRPAAVRRRQAVGERTRGGSADRRVDRRGDDHAAERLPDQRSAAGGFAARAGEREPAEPVTGTDLATPGSFEDRLASADHASATWLNPAAFSLAPAGTFGNAPRTITDVRGPGWYIVDASFIKDIRFASSKVAQFKLEALNILNRPNVRTLQGANTFGNSNFGQTTIQVGFSRIFQLMFRLNF